MKIIQEGPVLDKMKEITSKVVGGVSKAGDTARNAIVNTKNTVDYLKGNRDTRFSYDDKGTVRDVRNTALKAYASEAGDWKIDKDSVNGMLRVRFDAKKVSTNLANRVNPSSNRSDSLADYITDYDRDTNTVTMELPLDGGRSGKKKQQKALNKRNKKESFNRNESFNESSDESPLELALQSFETGHWYDRDDFDNFEDYEEYDSYMNYGPAGFYEEFKDQLDFSEDFIAEYGNEYNEGLVLKGTEESVMTPTPIPYKGQVCDKDGKLIKKEGLILKEIKTVRADEIEWGDVIDDFVYGEVEDVNYPNPKTVTIRIRLDDGSLATYDFDSSAEVDIVEEGLSLKTESEDLLETPRLTLSIPEVVSNPVSGDSLVIKINGKDYKYVLPDSSDKTVSGVARTVADIQKHSDGKALAYLKKNMKLVKESIEDDDYEEVIKSVIRDVNKKNLDRDSEEYINQIESELKRKNISVDADQLGSIIVSLDESLEDPTMTTEEVEDFYSKELSEGSSFKDNHICQGCGNPLSKCTCDVDTKEEDIDFDTLEENYTYDDEWTYKESDAVNSPTWIRYPFKTTERLRGNKLRWVLFKYSLARNTYMQVKVFDTAEEAKEFADNTSVFKKKKKECTQPSSIGQYKTDSIDLIDSEEGLNE